MKYVMDLILMMLFMMKHDFGSWILELAWLLAWWIGYVGVDLPGLAIYFDSTYCMCWSTRTGYCHLRVFGLVA